MWVKPGPEGSPCECRDVIIVYAEHREYVNFLVQLHFSTKYDENATVIDEDFEKRIAGISFNQIRIVSKRN